MNKVPILDFAYPALSPAEVRLLLLLSRPALSPPQQDRARHLVPQVEDWPTFIETAWRKFVLTMIYQNLAALDQGKPDDDVLGSMRRLAIGMTSEILHRHAAFSWFHEHCVLASGQPYAYFKGPALAARFYPDPAQRFYRDIDILVQPAHMREFLLFAIKQGCRVFLKSETDAEPDLSRDDKMAEFLEMNQTPQLVTPRGLLVEVHDEIDRRTSLFSTQELVRDALDVDMQNHRIRVLPDMPHIAFLCYHHTRHLWSKLNWLADLDAICTHPEFDREAVLNYARGLNLEVTLAASFELHDLASQGLHPTDFDEVTPGRELLSTCVTCLAGDDKLEEQMRQGKMLPFDWQDVPVSPWRRTKWKVRKAWPVYSELRAIPGGRRLLWLRYALATGLKLQRYAVRRLQGVLRK